VHAPHAVLDRNLGIAGKQEVDVDRVTRAVLHRARGRDQHLGEQLAAEDPGPEVLDAARFETIFAERIGVERIEQRLGRAGHGRARLLYRKRRVKVWAREQATKRQADSLPRRRLPRHTEHVVALAGPAHQRPRHKG
jgi:hypothetical protein